MFKRGSNPLNALPEALNADLETVRQKAIRDVTERIAPQAIETLRQTILAEINAAFEQRLENLTALLVAAPGDFLTLIERGVIPFRTRAFEQPHERAGIEIQVPHSGRGRAPLVGQAGSKQFELPKGLYRLLILATPIGPKDELSKEDTAFIRDGY